MNPEHYHSMTDAQIQEWHQLSSRVERLTELLRQEQIANADLRAAIANSEETLDIAIAEHRADQDQYAREIREMTERWMLTKNELAALTEYLPMILVDWLAPFEAFSDAGLSPEFVVRRQRVRYLIELIGLQAI